MAPAAADIPSNWTVGPGIVAVDTDYVRPRLDASHVIVDAGRAAFVDTGTNDSVPNLLAALEGLDIDVADVDYVFLTHIHLDHAGGAGLLMQKLPNARCVVHPRAARHMADPAKLVAGTEAVYGAARAREMYGEIRAIDEARLDIAGDGDGYRLGSRELRALHTEGHARHHYCLHDPHASAVFTGDSFGISYREFDNEKGEFIYPTTTPPHFDPPEAHRSVERILALEPEVLYLTHYSRVGNVGRLAGDMHECLDAYVALAEEYEGHEARQSALESAMLEYLFGRLKEHGYAGSAEQARSMLAIDARLNSQGLDAWLARRDT